MTFKADFTKIKRWREERQWSQEHLADIAGIGVRTVQRIENGDTASRDSMMALAAAFNVDVFALSIDPEVEAAEIVAKEHAKAVAGGRLSLGIHMAGYIIGMVVFAAISIGSGSFVMLWPMLWWTVGLVAHAATVFIVELAVRHKAQFTTKS